MSIRTRKMTLKFAAMTMLAATAVRGDDAPAAVRVRAEPIVPAAKAAVAVKAEPVKAALEVKAHPVAGAVKVEVLAGPVVEALGKKLVIKDAAAAIAPNDAVIQQHVQQYRPILSSELAFVRQMCDLSPKDRAVIRAAAEAGLKDAATQMAAYQNRNQRQVAMPGAGVARTTEPASPRTVVRQAIEAALKDVLSPEQWKEFSHESNQRIASRKQAAIMDTVARLDVTLNLTLEQRTDITNSIAAAWQDKWEEWLMMYVYGGRYFPVVPDSVVVSHLTKDQQSVWTTLQKINMGFYERVELVVEQDDWWGTPPEQPLPAAAGI